VRSYAEAVLSERDKGLLRRAEALVASLPDEATPGEVRCHELARAVGRVLGLPVQDGRYGMVEHSWLWTEEPRGRQPNVIDVYAVGRLPMVQLVDMGHFLPENRSYVPGPERDDVRGDVVDLLVESMSR
jgi:hypothetical protein